MSTQELVLNQLRRDNTVVTVKTINDETITGVIKGFDPFCILLMTDNSLQLIYKHALKSILLSKDFVIKTSTEKQPVKRS